MSNVGPLLAFYLVFGFHDARQCLFPPLQLLLSSTRYEVMGLQMNNMKNTGVCMGWRLLIAVTNIIFIAKKPLVEVKSFCLVDAGVNIKQW